MTTEEILREDKKKLAQIESAINMLAADKRPKTVLLRNKFIKLRMLVRESIQSNERALMLEKYRKNVLGALTKDIC